MFFVYFFILAGQHSTRRFLKCVTGARPPGGVEFLLGRQSVALIRLTVADAIRLVDLLPRLESLHDAVPETGKIAQC